MNKFAAEIAKDLVCAFLSKYSPGGASPETAEKIAIMYKTIYNTLKTEITEK